MRFMHLVAPLSRLFRSASPVAPSPQDKAAALNSGPPEFIDATALGNGDASRRAAAILELQDGEVLHKLAGLSGDASPPAPASLERTAQERMAQKRMAQLLDAGAIDFGRLCETTENTSALLAIAGLSGNPAHLPQALALIEDPNQVATLVLEGSSSRIRQFAAQTIEDPAELKQLLKAELLRILASVDAGQC